MSFLSDISIRGKVLSTFALLLMLAAWLGGFVLLRVAVLVGDSNAILGDIQAFDPLTIMANDAERLRAIVILSKLTTTAAQASDVAAREAAAIQDYNKNWVSYEPTMRAGTERADGKVFSADWGMIIDTVSRINAAERSGDAAMASSLVMIELTQEIKKFRKDMEAAIAYQSAQAMAADERANAAGRSTIIWTCVALGIMLAALAAFGWLLITSVAAPIGAMIAAMRRLAAQDMMVEIPGVGRKDDIGAMAATVQVFKDNGLEKRRLEAEAEAARAAVEAERRQAQAATEAAAAQQAVVVKSLADGLSSLAKGDLAFRLKTPFSAGYEKLRTDFNNALGTLEGTMVSIAANTQGVRAGAEEITQASDDLAKRTEQQAASLEETAVALDEIAATVRKTAEGAKEARQVVAAAKTDAEHSGEVVRQAVAAMGGIENSSKEIGNIIGVIDEIAFQTNLLALNAGVEAARAGDAGRGFAVVATQVRALAQRSTDAAKEIKTLISASGEQVASGVTLVGETGKALGRMLEQVDRVNQLVGDIAASAQEQATGLQQVNTAVNHMDQVTQQNAAMVGDSTAASHSLAGEASELARLVAQFQTGAAAQPYATPRRVPKAAPKPAPAPAKSRIPVHAPKPVGKFIAAPEKAAIPVVAGGDNWDEA